MEQLLKLFNLKENDLNIQIKDYEELRQLIISEELQSIVNKKFNAIRDIIIDNM